MATEDLHKKIREDGPAVPGICLWTDTQMDTQTDRQTECNTPLPTGAE